METLNLWCENFKKNSLETEAITGIFEELLAPLNCT